MARQEYTRSATGSSGSSPDGEARRAALVLAVSEYTDTALRQLRSPAGDAEDFGQVLSQADLGGFDVTAVLDGRAYEIRLAVEEFLEACGPEDLALVYLSCHGLVDARRRLYFAATDTLKDRLASTGVEARWLLDQLDECRARRQVVILDCCFSGAFATSAKGVNTVEVGNELLGQGRGRVVLTASRATEYSFEGTPTEASAIPGSVFTAALTSGIRSGAADTDEDGYISVDDAYAYAFDEMRAAGAEQTPQRWLYGAEGDIVLAKSPTSSGTAAGIPTRRPGSVLTGSGPTGPVHVPGAAQAGDGSGWRPPPWWKAGRVSFLSAAAAAVVAVVAAGVVIWWPGTGGDGSAFTFRDGRYVDSSVPWRLTVSAGPDAPSNGCTVEVRNQTKSGAVVASTQYPSGQDNVILQVKNTGSFYLDYEAGCLVNADEGSGDANYPVSISAGVGDSLAWNPSGRMEITAEGSSSFPCEVNMVDAETGGIESVTVESADDTERYDPPDTSTMYMSVRGANCLMKARDAATTGS